MNVVLGHTRVHWMIGHPVTQVHMPGLLNAWFDRAGLQEVLVPLDVPPADLAGALAVYQAASNVHGLVCTMPHKAALAGLVHRRSARAEALGMVNAVRKERGLLVGDNFDGDGLVAALLALPVGVAGRCAGVVGCGGFGSAAAYALLDGGLDRLHLSDIDPQRAVALAASLGQRFGSERVQPVAAPPPSVEILINASPVGMKLDDPAPCQLSSLPRLRVVADAAAGKPTPLLAMAAALGVATVTGQDIARGQMERLLRFLEIGT